MSFVSQLRPWSCPQIHYFHARLHNEAGCVHLRQLHPAQLSTPEVASRLGDDQAQLSTLEVPSEGESVQIGLSHQPLLSAPEVASQLRDDLCWLQRKGESAPRSRRPFQCSLFVPRVPSPPPNLHLLLPLPASRPAHGHLADHHFYPVKARWRAPRPWLRDESSPSANPVLKVALPNASRWMLHFGEW